MGYKKLISPEFRVTVGDYEVTDGIEVECFSSKESHMDWCRVELSPQLQGVLKFKDMDEASVELGYEDDFDSLIDGYVRCGDTDYWKEIMIKDDMMKLDRVTIKASFVLMQWACLSRLKLVQSVARKTELLEWASVLIQTSARELLILV